jgi:hypothetical protein
MSERVARECGLVSRELAKMADRLDSLEVPAEASLARAMSRALSRLALDSMDDTAPITIPPFLRRR